MKRSRQITAYQQELKSQISESYIGRNAAPSKLSSAQQAARTLDKYRIGAKAEATERRNIMFRANVKASSAVAEPSRKSTSSCSGMPPNTHGRAEGATATLLFSAIMEPTTFKLSSIR